MHLQSLLDDVSPLSAIFLEVGIRCHKCHRVEKTPFMVIGRLI